jgi:hypothetical protein
MQQYKNENIESVLNLVEDKTSRISYLLSDFSPLQKYQIDSLLKLYEERRESLEILAEWYHSANGKGETNNNKKEIGIRVEKILTDDEINIRQIKLKLDEIGQKLRNLARNKSLLIYTK